MSGESPRRRRTELVLLALGMVVIGFAYALVGLARSSRLPVDIVPLLGMVFALFVGAHVVTRRVAPDADATLLPVAALLNGIGYVLIARIDQDLAALQATWTAVGIAGYVLTLLFVRRVKVVSRYAYTAGLVGVALLCLPLVRGVGVSINSSRIWAHVGPIRFQPGEFAKVALAVFFAAYLTDRREVLGMGTHRLGPISVPEPRDLLPVLAAWGFSIVVMVFEKDLGSALLFFVLFLVLIWLGTGRAAYVVIGSVLFAAAAYGSWTRFSHVKVRVTAWLNPWSDAGGAGYQVIQGVYAFAWGGIGGTGLGQGLGGNAIGSGTRVPVAESDMIFAIVGEELGLVGATAVLAAFLLLAGTGLRIAASARDGFTKLFAAGLSTLLAVQSFLIIAGITRVLPLTGVTLPFLSYGGSSLVANYVLIALLVRMSDEVNASGGPAPRTTLRTRRAARRLQGATG